MNCKPGDLAIIVREEPGCEGNIGKIVNVIEAYDSSNWIVTTSSSLKCVEFNTGIFVDSFPGEEVYIGDHCLKPLRDSDGQDESLTWKPRIKEDVV